MACHNWWGMFSCCFWVKIPALWLICSAKASVRPYKDDTISWSCSCRTCMFCVTLFKVLPWSAFELLLTYCCFTQTYNHKKIYKNRILLYFYITKNSCFTINVSVLQVLPECHGSKLQTFHTRQWVLSQLFDKTESQVFNKWSWFTH